MIPIKARDLSFILVHEIILLRNDISNLVPKQTHTGIKVANLFHTSRLGVWV